MAGFLALCGIVALAWMVLGRSPTPPVFASEAEARAAWAQHFPELPAGTVSLTTRRAAALVMTAEGPGLVWPGGGQPPRLLKGAIARPTPTGLDLKLPDPEAPHLRLVLTTTETRAWARVIAGGDRWPLS